MQALLEKLHLLPREHRQVIAFASAGFLSTLIFFMWLLVGGPALPPPHGSGGGVEQQSATVVRSDPTPFATLKENFVSIFTGTKKQIENIRDDTGF